MRTCSPYVALPFDPGRLRPELVGLLLHPVSRSETWRRLVTHASFVKAGEVYFQASQPGSWPAWRSQAQSQTSGRDRLADVSQTAGTGRFGGNQTAKSYLLILSELGDFLKDFHEELPA